MIAYVNGILDYIGEDAVIIDIGGLGYQVKISSDTILRLPSIGEKIKLYTYTCVREDAFLLYGFLSRNELEVFKQCITVNGIGPKGALAILSVMDANSLRCAILSGDVKAITKAPGIGTKTAERLILDLKDKVKMDDSVIQHEIQQYYIPGNGKNEENVQIQEAVEALVALGYGQTESLNAIRKIENHDTMNSSMLLKNALKNMY